MSYQDVSNIGWAIQRSKEFTQPKFYEYMQKYECEMSRICMMNLNMI